MKKKWLLLVMVVLLLAVSAVPALAGYDWCYDDPVVVLPNGHRVNVEVAVPKEDASQPVFMYIKAPFGSKLEKDESGNIPLYIFFNPSDMHYRITAVADPSGMYPVRLKVSEDEKVLAEKTGRPGTPVHVRVKVH